MGVNFKQEETNMIYFTNITSLEDLKVQYKALAKKHHPDLGGSTEAMQAINAEYDEILSKGLFSKKENYETEILHRDIIEQLVVLEGLTIEICGLWLWVGGKTFQVKDKLKALGLKFSGQKKLWYYKPYEDTKTRRKTLEMDRIRSVYGSMEIKACGRMKLT